MRLIGTHPEQEGELRLARRVEVSTQRITHLRLDTCDEQRALEKAKHLWPSTRQKRRNEKQAELRGAKTKDDKGISIHDTA